MDKGGMEDGKELGGIWIKKGMEDGGRMEERWMKG